MSIQKWLKSKIRKMLLEEETPKGRDFVLTTTNREGVVDYVIKGRTGLMLVGMPVGKITGVRLVPRHEAVDPKQFDKLFKYFLGDVKVKWE